MASKTIRWGIAGAGAISTDFAMAMLTVSNASLHAVAARNKDRADDFAKRMGAQVAYGSYEDLAEDKDVDIVYVGVTNQEHKAVSQILLDAGKNVLCEKPATPTYSDTEDLIEKAKSMNVFFMEGVWTRFSPVYAKVRELKENGTLGKLTYFSGVVSPHNSINEDAEWESVKKNRRLWDPSYGGSILLDTGIYPVAMALEAFDNELPDTTRAVGIKAKATKDGSGQENGLLFGSKIEDGVDVQGSLVASFPGGGLASVRWGMRGYEEETFTISGTRATAVVWPRAHAPTRMEVHFHAGEEAGSKQEYKYGLPEVPQGFTDTNYPNSMGFAFEIEQVSADVAEGKRQSDIYPWEHMLKVSRVLEDARKDMGVHFPFEATPIGGKEGGPQRQGKGKKTKKRGCLRF